MFGGILVLILLIFHQYNCADLEILIAEIIRDIADATEVNLVTDFGAKEAYNYFYIHKYLQKPLRIFDL